jgi:hypothetical protein
MIFSAVAMVNKMNVLRRQMVAQKNSIFFLK